MDLEVGHVGPDGLCNGHVCEKCGTDIPWCVATNLCDHCLMAPMEGRWIAR